MLYLSSTSYSMSCNSLFGLISLYLMVSVSLTSLSGSPGGWMWTKLIKWERTYRKWLFLSSLPFLSLKLNCLLLSVQVSEEMRRSERWRCFPSSKKKLPFYQVRLCIQFQYQVDQPWIPYEANETWSFSLYSEKDTLFVSRGADEIAKHHIR